MDTTKAIDIPGMIRQASRRVGVDQLVSQGRKHIALLSREKMAALIHQAAAAIIEKHRGESTVPAGKIEEESREEFARMVRQYEMADRALADVEQSKRTLVGELAALRRDLDRQKAADRVERAPAAGFRDFAAELDRQAALVFDRRRLIQGHAGSPEETAELAGVEETLKAIITRILEAENERFKAEGGRGREIEMLQKRIVILQDHIATLEASFKSLSESKSSSTQEVRNVLRRLGLDADDGQLESKRTMLKVILDANKAQKTQAADLERRGITLMAPHAAVAV